MLDITLAVLPVFALIFLGSLLRRAAFPGDGFWAPAERLVYWVMFPALLVVTLARANFAAIPAWSMIAAVDSAILVMAAIVLALKPLLNIAGPAFTSLFQGAVRMNTYIGLTVAFGVHGAAGLTAAALVVAAFVPLVNVLCVAMLARYGTVAGSGVPGALRELARNPLILACIAGIGLNLAGIGLPPVLGPLLDILARAALPLGLLAVGAALNLGAVHADRHLALLASGLKLVGLPALTAFAAWALGVTGVAAFAAVLFAALPTATSAYILARQLGGDATLMANLVTLQTLAALVSLPLVLALLT